MKLTSSLLIDGLAFLCQKGTKNMEKWKDVPGYESIYEASDLGRIRTKEGKVTSNARYPVRIWKQRILKPKLARRKNTSVMDERVSLWKDGKEKTFLVARIVAMTWCEGYQEGLTVNHKDGNTMNNRADNLEWVSLADNIRHGFNTGLYPNQKQCVLVGNDKTLSFRSLSEAGTGIGRNSGYIRNCIFKGRPIVSATGEVYSIQIGKGC